MYFLNNVNNRVSFESVAQAMGNSGIPMQKAKNTWSYLRSEIPLTTTTNQYRIPILVNDTTYGSPNVTERRLQLQDAFGVAAIGVFLAVPASAAAYAAGAFQINSYPTLALFTAAQGLAMTALYNGWITLMVGQNQLMTGWDLWQHWKSNQTQAAASGDYDQSDYTTDGFYPMEPNVIHVGSTNIVMQLNLPAAISALPTNPTKLIIIQRGIQAQNVTSVTNS